MLTIRSLISYLKLKFKHHEVYFEGQCLQCGNCCRHIYLFENSGKIIKSRRQFNKLLKKHPDHDRFEIVAKDNGGLVFKCNWLTEEDTCKDHENRLQLCRNYPSKVMYYTNFTTGEYCGYRLKTGASFSKVLTKECKKAEELNENAD